MVGCCVPGFRVDLNFGFPFQLAGVTYRARLLCSWVARRPELWFLFQLAGVTHCSRLLWSWVSHRPETIVGCLGFA